jgi:hypothetical protein
VVFSPDGTHVAAWASMKSIKAKDGSSDPPGPGRSGEQDFHGEKRSNSRHASTTDPEAQLYRKGQGKEGTRPVKAALRSGESRSEVM